MLKNIYNNFFVTVFCVFIVGCANFQGGSQSLPKHPFSSMEADWIRNGEPIDFEGALWFPADDIEVLLDGEVYKVGEVDGIYIFVEKRDVRPYERLYTKFDKNQFRYFEKKNK